MRCAYPQRRRQGGVAAIELALIMLFFMGLLPVALLFGRALLAYTVMQKGVHDAARYMATVPPQTITNYATASQQVAVARQMVIAALVETWPGIDAGRVIIECVYADDVYYCGAYATRPLQVRVKLTVDMPIDFLPALMGLWLPELSSIPLRANATLRYGN